jgi:hypothetical protein
VGNVGKADEQSMTRADLASGFSQDAIKFHWRHNRADDYRNILLILNSVDMTKTGSHRIKGIMVSLSNPAGEP